MPNLKEDIGIDLDPAQIVPPVKKEFLDGKEDEKTAPSKPGEVDPILALQLRLRWLEALILGVKQDFGKDRSGSKGKNRETDYATVNPALAIAAAHLKPGDTLVRLTETVQSKLNKSLEGNEGLKRFMGSCMSSLRLLKYLTVKNKIAR